MKSGKKFFEWLGAQYYKNGGYTDLFKKNWPVWAKSSFIMGFHNQRMAAINSGPVKADEK